jgi:hypothetical protein
MAKVKKTLRQRVAELERIVDNICSTRYEDDSDEEECPVEGDEDEQYSGRTGWAIGIEAKSGRFFYGGTIYQSDGPTKDYWTEKVADAEVAATIDIAKNMMKRVEKRLRKAGFDKDDYYGPYLYRAHAPYVGMGHYGDWELTDTQPVKTKKSR